MRRAARQKLERLRRAGRQAFVLFQIFIHPSLPFAIDERKVARRQSKSQQDQEEFERLEYRAVHEYGCIQVEYA